MPITAFDHVNIRTADLAAARAFYADILGLTDGPRPDFGFAGAWMYLGDTALVHLIAVPEIDGPSDGLSLEHFALRATGLAEFLARLDAQGIRYRKGALPDGSVIQVNLWDPDGNHIHVDFPGTEG